MTAFYTQTFVPLDGNLSITLPESLRGKKIRISAEPERQDAEDKRDEDADEGLFANFCKNFRPSDYSSMSDEEYIRRIRALRGILTGPVDYSDLREETDREL